MNEGYHREIGSTQVEVPTPPPPGFDSPFKTVKDWLGFIIDNNNPETPVEEYCFGLYEAPGDNLLSLVGYRHTVEQGVPTSRIIFKPPDHMFFSLPKAEYGNLSQQQTKDRLLKELIQFTETDKFKSSFLSKCYNITTNFSNQIWSK